MIHFDSKNAYNAFNKTLLKTEDWLRPRVFSVLRVSPKIVNSRLLQIISRILEADYLEVCSKRLNQGNKNIIPESEVLKLSGLLLVTETGKISISSGLWIKNILKFLFFWLKFTAAILRGFFGNKVSPTNVTIVEGVPIQWILQGNDDSAFFDFCRKGPVKALSNAKSLWIEPTSRVKLKRKHEDFQYTFSAILELIAHSKLGSVKRLNLFFTYLYLPGKCLYIFFKFPLLVLLAKDAAEFPSIQILIEHSILKEWVQHSGGLSQPLWMRHFSSRKFEPRLTTHMYHYSQNSRPFFYKGDSINECVLPTWIHTSVNVHWVWTKGYQEFWSSLNPESKIHVVGPILGYLPRGKLRRKNDYVRVGIFDVDPRADTITRKNLCDPIYTADGMIRFVADIVNVAKCAAEDTQLNIDLCLKGKVKSPASLSQTSPKYITYLQQQVESKSISLLDRKTNLWTMIDSCDCIIAVPYTSPAYVADHLGVDAIFYDPTEDIRPTYEKTNNVSFCSGEEELYRKLVTLFKRKLSKQS
jgi:hypothetical protein